MAIDGSSYLIKDENEMLMRFLFGQKLLHVVRTSTEGISRVENLNNDVGRVDHFIQFVPNTARLVLRKLRGGKEE